MSIGRIMSKVVNYGAKYMKTTHKAVQGYTKTHALQQGLKKAAPEMNILGKIESNTSGRILRMQEAKQAFTPVKPFATTVTKENVPTLQKINEITGVTRGAVKDATGYFNKRACADALAAFKHEPVKIQPTKTARLGVHSSVPTQQKIDTMLGVGKVDALKQYEQGGRATREILENRAAAREAFSSGKETIPRWRLKYEKFALPKSNITESFKTIKSFQAEQAAQMLEKLKVFKEANLSIIKKFGVNS